MEVRGGNIPADVSLDVPGLEIHVLSRPFHQAAGGGDVHYVSSCGTGRITRLLLADVAGHGSDVTGIAKVLHDLMRRHVNHIDQRQFAHRMNSEFNGLTQSGQFATALIATYFAPTARFTLINAGHPPPLLYRAATRQWTLMFDRENADTANNFPLGILDLTQYEEFEIALGEGDAVLCYTDALPESRDAAGELIGYARIRELAPEIETGETLDIWIRRWLARIDQISPGNLLSDDLTVLLMRAIPGPTRAPFFRRLIGEMKTVVSPISWPEITWQNLGGSIFPWLSRKNASSTRRIGNSPLATAADRLIQTDCYRATASIQSAA